MSYRVHALPVNDAITGSVVAVVTIAVIAAVIADISFVIAGVTKPPERKWSHLLMKAGITFDEGSCAFGLRPTCHMYHLIYKL